MWASASTTSSRPTKLLQAVPLHLHHLNRVDFVQEAEYCVDQSSIYGRNQYRDTTSACSFNWALCFYNPSLKGLQTMPFLKLAGVKGWRYIGQLAGWWHSFLPWCNESLQDTVRRAAYSSFGLRVCDIIKGVCLIRSFLSMKQIMPLQSITFLKHAPVSWALETWWWAWGIVPQHPWTCHHLQSACNGIHIDPPFVNRSHILLLVTRGRY